MIKTVSSTHSAYNIFLDSDNLKYADRYFNLNRKVLIVTDNGVPTTYVNQIKTLCLQPYCVTLQQGESSKTANSLLSLLQFLSEHLFTRYDCIVAVGGGIVGDIAGLTASLYMRGIDYYNVPTTVLSQVDACIGGKTAVNFCGSKNLLGTFYEPRAVIIDFNTLSTLPKRQISNGLAEAIKVGMTHNPQILDLLSFHNINEVLPSVIIKSLEIKADIVQRDLKETGLRRVLNFGHTVGHALESLNDFSGLYHGECVALGMLAMSSESARDRLLPILKSLDLPTAYRFNENAVMDAVHHDKKNNSKYIHCVTVDTPGSFRFCDLTFDEIRDRLQYICERK